MDKATLQQVIMAMRQSANPKPPVPDPINSVTRKLKKLWS
jgi:hypothetical protein